MNTVFKMVFLLLFSLEVSQGAQNLSNVDAPSRKAPEQFVVISYTNTIGFVHKVQEAGIRICADVTGSNLVGRLSLNRKLKPKDLAHSFARAIPEYTFRVVAGTDTLVMEPKENQTLSWEVSTSIENTPFWDFIDAHDGLSLHRHEITTFYRGFASFVDFPVSVSSENELVSDLLTKLIAQSQTACWIVYRTPRNILVLTIAGVKQ